MVARLANAVRRHPFVTFLVLTLVVSWWPWPLSAVGLSPLPIFPPGPFVAALIVTEAT